MLACPARCWTYLGCTPLLRSNVKQECLRSCQRSVRRLGPVLRQGRDLAGRGLRARAPLRDGRRGGAVVAARGLGRGPQARPSGRRPADLRLGRFRPRLALRPDRRGGPYRQRDPRPGRDRPARHGHPKSAADERIGVNARKQSEYSREGARYMEPYRSSRGEETVVSERASVRVLMWAGFPLLGAGVGWLVKAVTGCVVSRTWTPLRGP